MREAYVHCQALVRDADRDRYLATLFLPAHVRPHAYALYAFNAEVTAVRERVREPLAGEVRLQWWSDALAGKAAGDAARNPVAAALIDTVERRGLSTELLGALIEAHRTDLYQEAFASFPDLEAYLRATTSTLFSLVASLLGREEAATSAANSAGIAYGIVGLLRAFPHHASHGRLYLPLELLKSAGTDRNHINAGHVTAGVRAALAEMRERARTALADATERVNSTPFEMRPAYLPLALVEGYLARMERSDYDPFRTAVDVPQWRRQLRLWRAAREL